VGREAPAGRILHLDAFSGIAGNMFLGALLDLGLSRQALEEGLAGLGLAFALRVRRVTRGPLRARFVRVEVPAGGRARRGRAETARGRSTRGASPSAHAAHSGARRGHSERRAGTLGAHAHGRRYCEIRRILDRARLDAGVRDRAQAIFAALAEAEARVHGVRVEDVHFHEVGAVDALVDVTGAALGLAQLDITRVTSSPVALGHGTVETAHGALPLPAPATLELLRGIPTVPAHVPWETVTPTGAAILRTVVEAYRPMPAMTVEKIGHGAGDDREGRMPNVLRAVLGRAGGPETDRVVALETNLDDFVPEHFDYLMERLFEEGALDVSIQHVQMKKSRPGFLLRVLARPDRRGALVRCLFAETPTLGVRVFEGDRVVLPREVRRVATAYGPIRVKLAAGPEGRIEVSAEVEDCKRAARRTGLPLRDVVRAAEEAARRHGT
jgi:pyridinium-3,5-bisthiocarboxylic acid mononucleotide nickel chelatase